MYDSNMFVPVQSWPVCICICTCDLTALDHIHATQPQTEACQHGRGVVHMHEEGGGAC
jgi:hypothetical protein